MGVKDRRKKVVANNENKSRRRVHCFVTACSLEVLHLPHPSFLSTPDTLFSFNSHIRERSLCCRSLLLLLPSSWFFIEVLWSVSLSFPLHRRLFSSHERMTQKVNLKEMISRNNKRRSDRQNDKSAGKHLKWNMDHDLFRSWSFFFLSLPFDCRELRARSRKRGEERNGEEELTQLHSFVRYDCSTSRSLSCLSLSHRREGRQALDASQDLRGKKEVNTWMSLRTDYLWCMTWKIRRKRGHLYCFFSSWILSRILWRLFTSLSFLCCLLNVNVLSASNV